MTTPRPTRYEVVSRRAVLRASLGAGALVFVPGIGCGNSDEQLLTGEVARSAPTSTAVPTPSPTPTVAATDGVAEVDVEESTPVEAAAAPTSSPVAVAGEMVVAFTYTQAAGGKDERPYVAVWVEDESGDLVETVELWYEQGRRGDRWLDHLTRWYDLNLSHVAAGGVDDTVTVSSATRTPGSYAVVWDGTADGVPVPAGDYHVCIEAVREEGPYSLIRQVFSLAGSLPETALSDDGELSAATVRVDA